MIQKQIQGRLLALDFVRVTALLGVVIYHSAAAYSTNTPYWSVHDGSSIIATGIRELADVFIMPIFFFLAGYFTLSSLRKRGYWSFFKSKFWELGYIWLLVVIIILPIIWWGVVVKSSGSSAGFVGFMVNMAEKHRPNPSRCCYRHHANGAYAFLVCFASFLFLHDIHFTLEG